MSNYMTYFTMTVIIVTIARIIMIYIEDIYMKYLSRRSSCFQYPADINTGTGKSLGRESAF